MWVETGILKWFALSNGNDREWNLVVGGEIWVKIKITVSCASQKLLMVVINLNYKSIIIFSTTR